MRVSQYLSTWCLYIYVYLLFENYHVSSVILKGLNCASHISLRDGTDVNTGSFLMCPPMYLLASLIYQCPAQADLED